MNRSEILEYLLDDDGSTRDITFTPAKADRVSSFLEVFFECFDIGELLDQDGEGVDRSVPIIMEKMKSEEGCIHGQLKSSQGIIEQAHLFLDWPEDEGIAIEISFFSHDLTKAFTLDAFLSLLNEWWALLECSQVFVRYENASWDWYNPKGLGVFYHASKA